MTDNSPLSFPFVNYIRKNKKMCKIATILISQFVNNAGQIYLVNKNIRRIQLW